MLSNIWVVLNSYNFSSAYISSEINGDLESKYIKHGQICVGTFPCALAVIILK